MYYPISDDGIRCVIIGSGDPNTLNVPLTGICTEGVFFNTLPDTRNPSAATTWVWSGTSWFTRP